MPLTIPDPNIALIVIDLQKRIVNGNFAHPIGEVVDRTRALMGVFLAKNRHSCEQGFNVTLALDAMTDVRGEARENGIRNVFTRPGGTGSTEEIISLLERRSSAS